MFQIENTKIYVGTKEDSRLRSDLTWAIVNTAKTVHVEVKGWSNSPPRDHPDYLAFEDGQFLSFNWVDGPSRMYDWSRPTAFIRALDFIDKWYGSKNILINCDLGQSRSPTVALLYLAKRMHVISEKSFTQARVDFQVLYPNYAPSGIADYVNEHWNVIQ
jgi:hypothetical protein